MKIDSIKYRLLLITFVCVFGMLLLIINQVYYTDKLIELNQQNKVLLRMSNELLQLRRHEKDFLLRKDSVYVDRFLTRAKTFEKDIAVLADITAQHDVATDLTDDIQVGFNDYRNKFSQLVEVLVKIGLEESMGQHKKLDETADALQAKIDAVGVRNMQSLFMQVRSFEKDFIIHLNPFYQSKQLETFTLFIEEVQYLVLEDLVLDIAMTYQNSFLTLSESLETVGLTHNQGLRGEFRSQAHFVEGRLENINTTLAPLIAEEERRVKVNGLLIMGLTIAALVILIVRSFVTFQRAFSNFVMFFYRCKREYQRMDERKLGFAEFKSLAAVANEMVEARRETETELKEVKQELATLKKAASE